ncbi:hypothetical protein HUT06_14890 [Actinomadura sp. NAK00032]|uniref:hypothetical protein n=1 Tax=Actinomadura sp. NAK00032 TaxID=2742128 RepID=UPI0015921B8C|nr:hypothetical protein [Actinomadura sp. NAK00032]QKW35161.1 hypothetical protein HUT06_14890 [Actinomadura sp. NAK00032]
MARRDNGHASRGDTHVSSWAETPARPSSRPAAGQARWSEEPQWPEGSWWSEQPDWFERGRKAARGEPGRREAKRREGRSRARREAQERPEPPAKRREPPAKRRDGRTDPFAVRNKGSGRADPFEARNRRTARPSDSRATRTDVPTVPPGRPAAPPSSPTPRDARAPQPRRGARTPGPERTPRPPQPARDARTPRSDARDARTARFDARDARTPQSEARDARTARFDARDARAARTARFDARGEGVGRGRRAERGRVERRGARSGPKARPRRGRRPGDRLGIGAIVLSTAVGLSLLGILERALLDGGPLGGTSGPVGSQRAIQPPKPGTDAPARPGQPSRRPAEGGGTGPAADGPSLRVLAAQVRKLTLAERGAAARQAYGAAPAQQPIVGATRTSADRTWVFGTTAIPVPESSAANPEVAFYAAHWTGKRWQVGLSGGAAFATLLAGMPAAVMPAAEGRLLREYGTVTAEGAAALVNGTRAGDRLMLPWKIGQVWAMTTSDGSARPLASLAFSGGDGRVVASAKGRLYRFCGNASGNAMVMLIHPSGLATTYYRLRNVTRLRDGGVVAQGGALGGTGTERPCGGAAAPRAEVGFGLRGGTGTVPLDGAEIGGWTFRERAKPLLGFAERGALQVLPGGLMANLGPVPAAAEEEPVPPSPSPSPSPEDGAGTAAAPAAAATENRSPNGANSQQ